MNSTTLCQRSAAVESRAAPEAEWPSQAGLANRDVGVYSRASIKRGMHHTGRRHLLSGAVETVGFTMQEAKGKCCRTRSGMMSHDMSRF